MKWVYAADLESWAARVNARYALSELVSALVRATAKSITAFSFPSGDSAQLPGYDGRLEAEGSPPYIPTGLSVWEFGTDKDPRAKAQKEYAKRTKKPGAVRPEDATFVFVTPRPFLSKDSWIKDRLEQKVWKDVRAINGVDLEAWLEGCPAVALDFAQRHLGKMPPTGIMSAEEFWADYQGRTEPRLKEAVLTAGRGPQIEELLQQLGGGGGQSIVIKADSQDEALAFTIAVMRTASEDIAKYLAARSVVADDATIARALAGHGNLIVGLRSFSSPLSSVLVQGGNIAIVPLGNDAPNQRITLELKRPARHDFAEALTSMGLEQERAERLARECGRSVTVLQRRIKAVAYTNPPWVSDHAARAVLIPALLVGAWDSKSEHDRNILAGLARSGYEDFERRLQPYLSIEAPPIERVGSVWTLVAPADCFELLARHISPQDLGLLHAAATEVFSEIDPRLDLPMGERPYAALHGKTLKHSSWLRDGLANTLVLIAALGEHANLHTGSSTQVYVNSLIENLPGLRENYRLIASLGAQLPYLMEAAPDPLLSALERLLEGDGSAIMDIFEESGLLGPSSSHTHVLWALEMLAWDPAYLSRVSLVLARMAQLDPGGRLANRPIGSLVSIYLPWHPCTNAPLVVRVGALDLLLRVFPDVGWNLLVRLLPQNHGVAHPTHSPRWREAGESEKETLTRSLVDSGYDEVVRRAIDLVGDEPARWSAILGKISLFTADERKRVYKYLLDFARKEAVPEEHRITVWRVLRERIQFLRRVASARRLLSAADFEQLDNALIELTPSDPVQVNLWLFDGFYPDVPLPEGRDRDDAAERLRLQALGAIFNSEGVDGIVRLARLARHADLVGWAVGSFIHDIKLLDVLVDSAVQGEDNKLKIFASSMSARSAQTLAAEWMGHVVSRAQRELWDPERIVTLISSWPDESATWKIAESLGSSVESLYWKQKAARYLRGSPEEIEFAARKYAEADRAADALESIRLRLTDVSSSLLLSLLDRVVMELNNTVQARDDLDWVEDVFSELADREDIGVMDLARREYSWLPVLEYRGGPRTLHKLLSVDPHFFVDVVCDVYKAHSRDSDEELTEERRLRAEFGYRLLKSWKALPGLSQDSTLDVEALESWISTARTAAAERDRADVADVHIGHLLAHSPLDPEDGGWPHREIRELLERVQAPKIEQGIQTEQFNKRGVSRKVLYEGGDQERELAGQARQWAKICASWPRTSRVLTEIANAWERYASHEDESAEQDKLRLA